ncbi:MAG TPA: CPBP family intramembrane glutamic endopeptidase [Caulobacteraceae bacterium]|jgi:hypothetical protein|nr:CPBP family intramembrane glutamic endopeptidase [Caulobacteraceae bacterium]
MPHSLRALAMTQSLELERTTDWGGVGLTVAIGIVGGLLIEAQALYLTQPLLIALTNRPPNLAWLRTVRGDWSLFALGIPLLWIITMSGETVFRGWLTERLTVLFAHAWRGRWGAIAVASVAYGLAHLSLGPVGVFEATIQGVLYSILYLATGRNLIAPIIAHGLQDCIDLTLGFTGCYPLAV